MISETQSTLRFEPEPGFFGCGLTSCFGAGGVFGGSLPEGGCCPGGVGGVAGGGVEAAGGGGGVAVVGLFAGAAGVGVDGACGGVDGAGGVLGWLTAGAGGNGFGV